MVDNYSLIADTLHGSIMLSSFEKDIMTTTLFNRLHGIYQNSTAYLTFPANRTRRTEHSFGTMYLCGLLYYSSICNADEDTVAAFFETVKGEIDKILHRIRRTDHGKKYAKNLGDVFQKLHSQYEKLVITGGIYNYYTPANIGDYQNEYKILFEGVRVAALLHDIGHPPFSHISENALNVVKDKITGKDKRNERENEFLEIIQESAETSGVKEENQLHERLGNTIADLLMMSVIPDISEDESKDDDLYQTQIYKILVVEIANSILNNVSPFFKDVHAIIDGTLDGDRLDYVSRDPANSGFSLGKTEYDRLAYKMKLCQERGHFLFCPSVSVVKTVEDFLMRRWNMYKNIIFHHRVVKTDSILQNIIVEIALDYLSEENTDSDKDDDLYILPYNISGLWKANRNQPSSREKTYAISQWDDTWLLTILKKSYFETYIEKSGCLHDQLEEFLTNHRNYFSLIKRIEDFREIDTAAAQVLRDRREELEAAMTELCSQSKTDQETETKQINIQGYLKGIEFVLDFVKEEKYGSFDKSDGFALNAVKRRLFPSHIYAFTDVLDQMVDEISEEKGDVFYAEKQPSTGTNKELYFYQKGEGKELIKLNEISNITKVLNDDLKFTPFFFIYINKRKFSEEPFSVLRERIGWCIGNAVVDYVLTILRGFVRDR